MQPSATSLIIMADVRQRELLADAKRAHRIAVNPAPSAGSRRLRTALGHGLTRLGTRLAGGVPPAPAASPAA